MNEVGMNVDIKPIKISQFKGINLNRHEQKWIWNSDIKSKNEHFNDKLWKWIILYKNEEII